MVHVQIDQINPTRSLVWISDCYSYMGYNIVLDNMHIAILNKVTKLIDKALV